MKRTIVGVVAVLLAGLPSTAFAHYPWFTIDAAAGKNGTLNLYFEEGPKPGDGQYLDPFVKDATFWMRASDGKTTPLKLQEVKKPGQRWLSVPLEVARPRAVDCYCKWGVYKGQLLYYYAKHIDAGSAADLQALGRADKLKFDLVPKPASGMVAVQALWDGKPKAGLSVMVAGPQVRTTLKTDEQGMIQFKPEGSRGLYSLRTSFVESDPAGTENGQQYRGLRQTATLTLTLPLE